jgi:hypothetical protein
MRALQKNIVYLSILLVITACQELIKLPLEQPQSRILIDGLITNRAGLQYVKVAYSLNYYDTGKLPIVPNAEVLLLDENKQIVEQFNYSSADSAYLPSGNFTGLVNQEYTLQVVVNQEIYEAKGVIKPNATLDSLYYLGKEELQQLGQNVFEGDFFMFVNGSISSNEIEYFKLKVLVNDTLRNSRGDIANSILSSEFFGKEFNFLPIPGSFKLQDSVKLELYSLTEDTYQYYVEFSNLLFNDGGVFSPPPVNPTSNIINTSKPDNYALGVIQFSAVLEKEIYIEEK